MYRNIVFHVSGSSEDGVRIAHAAQLARMFDAHLTGLLVRDMPDMIAFTEPAAGAVIRQLWEEAQRQSEAIAMRLTPTLAGLGLSYELRVLDAPPGQAASEVTAEVRTADLFVGTCPDGPAEGVAKLAEAVLLGSGRACVLVPPGNKPRRDFSTCLVAWNNSREAARAVAEAMPILQRAEKVIVAIVEEHGAGEQVGLAVGADIGRYMGRHDVDAEIRAIAGWADSGEAIVNEAKMTGADLIVMGGYGHSRLREWVLGGATRHVLATTPVPVLIAH